MHRVSGFEPRRSAARDVTVARDQQPFHRSHFSDMHSVTIQPSGHHFQVEDADAVPLPALMIEAITCGAVKGIKVKPLPCRVHKLESLADDVMGLHLKLPANEKL